MKKQPFSFVAIFVISLFATVSVNAEDSALNPEPVVQTEDPNGLESSVATSDKQTISPAGLPANLPGSLAAKAHNKEMSGQYLTQLVLGLLVVLVCIVVLAWFAKRINKFQSSTQGALSILGGLSMGSRERIVLLQAGDKQLLLGVAPGCVNTLHVFDEPITEGNERALNKNGTSNDASFASKLADVLAGYKSQANKVASPSKNCGEDK